LETLETPRAVLIIVGHSEVIKITKMAEGSAKLKIASEIGSQARGDTGLKSG
jgi:hypothetical protein